MTDPITPFDFAEIRWRGHWIWTKAPAMPAGPFPRMAPSTEPPRQAHALFRKTFALERVPARVPARITADSRYILFVNGREAFRGPVRSQPRRLHYDLLDLAPFLMPGVNVIAVHVKYYATPISYWMPAPPTSTLGKTGVLVFEADLGDPAQGGAGWLVSDETWKSIESDAWTGLPRGMGPGPGGGVPTEAFDARGFPYRWEQPGFEDKDWGEAHVISSLGMIGGSGRSQPPAAPYGPLYPRPIAPLGGETLLPAVLTIEYLEGPVDLSPASPARRVQLSVAQPVARSAKPGTFPVTLESEPRDDAGAVVRLVLDFGRIVFGFPQFDVDAPPGTVLEFAFVEDPIRDPSAAGLGAPHAGTRYVARGADDRFQTFDPYGLRYAYLLVHDASGPVTLKRLSVREQVYPWTPGAAFRCSDEALNHIYQAGIRTVELNSHDAFMDCPTREQRAWVGDSVVHQMVHLATNLDWRLAWHYLALSNSPRADGILPMAVAGDEEASGSVTIPDWSLHWVHGVYNLYRFQGDRKRVKSFMPTVERVLRWYEPYQTAQGLLKDVVEWNLVDWASVSNDDTAAILTALWARGLSEFAEMAAWLGEQASREWAQEIYDQIKAGFEAFWDEPRGSYVDHIVDGVPQPEMSQHSGALAILSDLAPRERWARIVDTITDPAKTVVRRWGFDSGRRRSPEKYAQLARGIREPDWDVENQIVMAQPFMSYVVHDAVAKAGKAGRLPELCRRWRQFLADGYDTIGETWGFGTHVHGWSCTPTRDLIFYTLGVTPAEPGYTIARIAPRLGDLAWAEGKVPTPHGLISVRAEPGQVVIDSPVPVTVDLPGRPARELPVGHHVVDRSSD
jgi:alpha-L-rhamnosidase